METDNSLGLLDRLFTPKQLAQRGIMSLVRQWQERRSGRLGYFQLGRRIFYSQKHLSDYLADCESKAIQVRKPTCKR